MILQSKMNYGNPFVYFVSERIAREFLKKVPHNSWVYFKDVPDNIRSEVINTLDSGYSSELRAVFDETATKFLITRDIPEKISLNLKRYYKPIS